MREKEKEKEIEERECVLERGEQIERRGGRKNLKHFCCKVLTANFLMEISSFKMVPFSFSFSKKKIIKNQSQLKQFLTTSCDNIYCTSINQPT